MSWQALEDGNQDLAEFGRKRFASNHVGYLATIRKDGSPRVHPMTPFVGEGHLFFFTNDGSLFCRDLQRDGRFSLHSSVEDQEGGQGEFYVRGHATIKNEPDLWVIAKKYVPYSDWDDNYVLFEFNIEYAFGRVYGKEQGFLQRWQKD